VRQIKFDEAAGIVAEEPAPAAPTP